MSPAPYHCNFFLKIVVSGISVCVEVALESLQKSLRMDSASARLVLVQHNRFVRVSAGAVQLHIAFALRYLPRLVEYLQFSLARVQLFIHRSEISSTAHSTQLDMVCRLRGMPWASIPVPAGTKENPSQTSES